MPTVGLRLILAIIAVLLAFLVLIGVDMGSLGDVRALALAIILAAIALVVP